MQRYFVTVSEHDEIIFSKDDIFHIEKVMRMKIGDSIEIVKNEKIYLANIISFSPFKIKIISESEQNNELKGFIRLFYAIPKGDKIDLVIQKAVELGVKEIVLINSTRSIAKINENNKEKKLLRFNKIIKEAAEQSKRNSLPILKDVISFEEINRYNADFSFICYESSKENLNGLYSSLKQIKNSTVNVIVGAEGGITPEELAIAKKAGYKEITLGKRILRSETACFYILSLISFFMELEGEHK